jgi:hypothetical protein
VKGKQYTREQVQQRAIDIGTTIHSLNKECIALNLRCASKQVRFITEWLSSKPVDMREFPKLLAELRRRTREDLEDAVMYSVNPDVVGDFYSVAEDGPLRGKLIKLSPEKLWGDDVCSNFKSAVRDIDDASECLIFQKGTASVFHLMRVMEVGLRALGKTLGNPKLDPKTNPSWDSILSKCDEELRLPYAKRSSGWQANAPFFTEATASLRAVKDAWRNPTMHVEKDYSYEQAYDIWSAARAFTKHLATTISEGVRLSLSI